MSWYDTLLSPIMWVVAWVMVHIHDVLQAIHVNEDVAWVASIIALVILMRALLIPLFVKQIKASRGLQLIQPEMQKIQKKYKGKTDPASRQKQSEEMMALYRKSGTNPMASCWPVLLQSPIFFGLFRVLYSLPLIAAVPPQRGPIGPLDQAAASAAEHATLFGAPLSASFLQANAVAPGFSPVTVRVVTVVLIVLMSLTTFTTQRQLTMKNMPQAALDNPMANTQKMMLYLMPLIFFFTGPGFPIGVLIYWLTTNLWTMGQQYYVIHRMPAPGSQAEARMKERQARKHHGTIDVIEQAEEEIKPAGQRQQPVGKSRSKKKGVRPSTAPAAKHDDSAKDGPGGAHGGKPDASTERPGAGGAKPAASADKPDGGNKPAAGGAAGASVAKKKSSGKNAGRTPGKNPGKRPGSPAPESEDKK